MVDSTPTAHGAAVDHEVDTAAQVAEHMRRGGRRDMAGAVSRRRHHRAAEAFQQRVATGCAGTRTATLSSPAVASSRRRSPAASAAPGSGVPARRRRRGARRRHRRRRPRAPRPGRHVGDQRIERGPALGGIEPRDRLAVAGVGAEPVDGLGREGDEAAGREAARRPPRCRRHRRSRTCVPGLGGHRVSGASQACVYGRGGYKTGPVGV